MRKYHTDLQENTPQGGRSRVPAVAALVLALLVSPLLYEGGQLLVGRWLSMTGSYRTPDTPILNVISEWSRSASVDANRFYYRLFNSGAWKPSTAIPLGIGWAVVMAMIFLRRVR